MKWVKSINAFKRQIITPDSVCGYCESKEDLTVDHIVPLSVLTLMGIDKFKAFDFPKNFMVVCNKCNQEKGKSIIRNHQPTLEAMIELLTK